YRTKACLVSIGCGGCVDDVVIVLGDDTPETIRTRIGWDTLEEDASRPGHEGTVHNVTMPRHPADISSTPIDIIRLDIKDIFSGGINTHRVATLHMHHALGLARAAAGIEDIERIFAVH